MDGSWVFVVELIGDFDVLIDIGIWEGGYCELYLCIDNEN